MVVSNGKYGSYSIWNFVLVTKITSTLNSGRNVYKFMRLNATETVLFNNNKNPRLGVHHTIMLFGLCTRLYESAYAAY